MTAVWPFRASPSPTLMPASKEALRGLRELGTAAGARAVGALGALAKEARVVRADAALVPPDAVAPLVARHADAAFAAVARLDRGAPGFGALLLGREAAGRLVAAMLGRPPAPGASVDRLGESALAEAASIALQAMAAEAAARTNLRLGLAPPETTWAFRTRAEALSKPPPEATAALVAEARFDAAGAAGTALLVFWTPGR